MTSQVQPGSIILFHNAAEHTPEALPGILQFLIAQGYTIVPISQLICQGQCGTDYTIDHTGRQSAVRKTADGAAQPQSGAASQSNAAAQSGAAQPRS